MPSFEIIQRYPVISRFGTPVFSEKGSEKVGAKVRGQKHIGATDYGIVGRRHGVPQYSMIKAIVALHGAG